MANHGFVTTKLNLNDLKLETAITNFVQHTWQDKVKIEINTFNNTNKTEKEFAIYLNDQLYPQFQHGFVLIWLNSKRKIEFRPQGCGDISFYIYYRIQEHLAQLFNGIISDEGISDKWTPQFKYHNFESYMKNRFVFPNMNTDEAKLFKLFKLFEYFNQKIMDKYPQEILSL